MGHSVANKSRVFGFRPPPRSLAGFRIWLVGALNPESSFLGGVSFLGYEWWGVSFLDGVSFHKETRSSTLVAQVSGGCDAPPSLPQGPEAGPPW